MKIWNYAWRIITRMKAYSAICILSLVVSLAGTLTLVRYIHQELTVDGYLENLDRLFMLTYRPAESNRLLLGDNRNWNNDKGFIDPLDHPAVEASTTLYMMDGGEVECGGHHYAVRSVAVDSTFFRLLPREAVVGEVKSIPPTGIILSKEMADRLFTAGTDPIGRPLKFGGKEVTVTGVMKPLPGKASFQYDVILSHALHTEWLGTGASAVCLAQLYRAEDLDAVNAWQKPQTLSWWRNGDILYSLVPLAENYFTPGLMSHNFIKGDLDSIRILGFVAVLLFAIGLFNYWNLYTVIMQKRGLEFGVRKVFGAGRWQLFKQLYVENFALALVAGLFICTVMELTDKVLAHSLDIPIWNNVAFNVELGFGMLFGFPLLTTLYPYFRYLYSRPVSSMRGLRTGRRGILSRSLFLFVQYVISICLIIVSIYFARQLDDMLNADLGFHTKDILRCTLLPPETRDVVYHSDEEWQNHRDKQIATAHKIVHELDACPDIIYWSLDEALWQSDRSLRPFFKKADTSDGYHAGSVRFLSTAAFEMFGMQLVEGRMWSDSIDHFSSYNLIINEAAKRELGITDIRTDLVQTKDRLWWSMDEDCSGNPPFRVVGVIKDYRAGHLSKGVAPTIFLYNPTVADYINPGDPFIIRYVPGKRQEVVSFLANLRNEVAGEGDFEYSFLEDDIAKLYENDRRIVRIYLIFAGLAIAVSCLGLFGLSLFEVRLRYREIALRKVHGAHARHIVGLLCRRYLWLLGVSAAVAVPLSVWFIHWYMADYAYRAPLSVWIFLGALAIVALISAAVLCWQVHRAATLNPAEVVKSE